MANRYLSNLFTTRWSLTRHFGTRVLRAIELAVRDSEQQHSGELRFAIEASLDFPALLRGTTARDRAIEAFSQLRTWDTEANNGVLIYLLLSEHDIEIVADRGYTGKVSHAEWQDVCRHMKDQYSAGHFEAGSLEGIELVTQLIRRHFPRSADDVNELPDKPVIL